MLLSQDPHLESPTQDTTSLQSDSQGFIKFHGCKDDNTELIPRVKKIQGLRDFMTNLVGG